MESVLDKKFVYRQINNIATGDVSPFNNQQISRRDLKFFFILS